MGDHVLPRNNVIPGSQEKKRCRTKCGYCRRAHDSCLPHERKWDDNLQEKCQRCLSKHLPCSGNHRRSSDPLAIADDGNDQDEGQDFSRTQSATISRSRGRITTQNLALTDLAAAADARTRETGVRITLTEELKNQATEGLKDLVALGETLLVASYQKPFLCPIQGQPGFHDHAADIIHAVKEECHQVFLHICESALEIGSQGSLEVARWILVTLILTMEKPPSIYDGRKRPTLLKVIAFFQEQQDEILVEILFTKLADMWDKNMLPSIQNPCGILAASMADSSERARKVHLRLWQKHFGKNNMPSNTAMPPFLRAAIRPMPHVVYAIARHSENPKDAPGLLNLQGLHLASVLGFADNVRVLSKFTNVEARDGYSRTSLFLAAANGHHNCCDALLSFGADTHSRDEHGHTILEVAAKGGHYDVVRLLIEFKAEINPPFLGPCASTPLQAAFESRHFNSDMIYFLIKKGADAWVPRHDGKNAIDLAEENGQKDMADYMREHCLNTQADPFDLPAF